MFFEHVVIKKRPKVPTLIIIMLNKGDIEYKVMILIADMLHGHLCPVQGYYCYKPFEFSSQDRDINPNIVTIDKNENKLYSVIKKQDEF